MHTLKGTAKYLLSDITLGDSWGTELSGEVKNGVSLILCQSEKGKELIESAGCLDWLVSIWQRNL